MSNPRFIIPCEGNKIRRTSWCSWQTLLSQHSQVDYKREGGLLEKVSGVCAPLPKTFTRIFPALIKAEALFLTKPFTKPYPLGPHINLLSHDIRKGRRQPGTVGNGLLKLTLELVSSIVISIKVGF